MVFIIKERGIQMKLKNIDQVHEFLKVVDECSEDVYLTSSFGDKYNLKSKLSQYIAVAALLGDHGEELELWCDNKDDEKKMLDYLAEHRDVM